MQTKSKWINLWLKIKGLEGPGQQFRVKHPFSILGMKMPRFPICNHIGGTRGIWAAVSQGMLCEMQNSQICTTRKLHSSLWQVPMLFIWETAEVLLIIILTCFSERQEIKTLQGSKKCWKQLKVIYVMLTFCGEPYPTCWLIIHNCIAPLKGCIRIQSYIYRGATDGVKTAVKVT